MQTSSYLISLFFFYYCDVLKPVCLSCLMIVLVFTYNFQGKRYNLDWKLNKLIMILFSIVIKCRLTNNGLCCDNCPYNMVYKHITSNPKLNNWAIENVSGILKLILKLTNKHKRPAMMWVLAEDSWSTLVAIVAWHDGQVVLVESGPTATTDSL